MSYPGFAGTNLAADLSTQYSTSASYYVKTSGVGPADIPTQLQSPAEVLPNSVGNCILSLPATAPNGSSQINIEAGALGSAKLTLQCAAPSYEIEANSAGQFTISAQALQANQGPVIQYDGNGTLTLGDDLFTGFGVVTNQQLKVGGPAILVATNGVVILPSSATESEIGQSVASGGTLTLGSSAAYNNTLVISDVGIPGTDNYILVNGTAGNAPLFIAGAQGGGNQCGIHPDISGTGQLLLGSSNNFTNQLQITNTAVQFNVAPVINTGLITTVGPIPATGTMVTNTDYIITNPSAIGLYAVVCAVNTSAAGTNNAQVSTIGFWNGGIWDYGGSGRSSPFGNGEVVIGFGLTTPQAVRTNLFVTFTGNTANPSLEVKFIPLFGNLGL
jgi:hypothetical protein